jgi:polysaccharide deacetylase 2 family uncharacterized protein YibQ
MVAGAGGLIYWLHASYDPHDEFIVPVVGMKLAPEPQEANEQKAAEKAPDVAPAPASSQEQPESTKAAPTAPTSESESKVAAGPESGNEQSVRVARPEPVVSGVVTLAPAPDPDLVETSEIGDLPIVASDGRTSLSVYARPHRSTGHPRIAVVLSDVGLNRERTIAAIRQLPGPITLAFSPYGSDLPELTRQAREGGHEILLQTPMEPLTFPLDDPGPHMLLTTLPAKANIERLEWVMSRFSGYTGIVSHMGSRFTFSDQHLQPVLTTLHRRGLMYLESATDGQSKASALGTALGLPNLAATVRLDREASAPHIDEQLQVLERAARQDGFAIAIANPYPVTIERLSQWSRTLADKELDLAPVSALLEQARKEGG